MIGEDPCGIGLLTFRSLVSALSRCRTSLAGLGSLMAARPDSRGFCKGSTSRARNAREMGHPRRTCDRPLSVISHCAGQHRARPARNAPSSLSPLRGSLVQCFCTHGLRRGLRSGAASRLMCPGGAAVDASLTIEIRTVSAKSADKGGATFAFRVVLSALSVSRDC